MLHALPSATLTLSRLHWVINCFRHLNRSIGYGARNAFRSRCYDFAQSTCVLGCIVRWAWLALLSDACRRRCRCRRRHRRRRCRRRRLNECIHNQSINKSNIHHQTIYLSIWRLKDFSRWVMLCAAFVLNTDVLIFVQHVAAATGTAAKSARSSTGLNISSTVSTINLYRCCTNFRRSCRSPSDA